MRDDEFIYYRAGDELNLQKSPMAQGLFYLSHAKAQRRKEK